MSHSLLISNKYKKPGWIILILSFIAGLYINITDFQFDWLFVKWPSLFQTPIIGRFKLFGIERVNLTETIIGILFITGALLVGFSKEKNEDEFIANIRLSSLLWAVLVNYALLLFAFIFIYELAFLHVMIYNMFTVLIIFIIRFNYILYKNSKSAADEK